MTQPPYYRKAFQAYLRYGIAPDEAMALFAHHDALSRKNERQNRPTRYYVWRTQNDGKVRPSHAANNGRLFAWDDPPPTGHPGEDYGCRCVAEPVYGLRSLTKEAFENIKKAIRDFLLWFPRNIPGTSWTNKEMIYYFYVNNGGVTLEDMGHAKGVRQFYEKHYLSNFF
jgi:SPP1 gp7 family putative phage head morphogenesis protein